MRGTSNAAAWRRPPDKPAATSTGDARSPRCARDGEDGRGELLAVSVRERVPRLVAP